MSEQLDTKNIDKLKKKVDLVKILNKSQPYKDKDFPPTKESLFNPKGSKLRSEEQSKWKKFKWYRASEIFKGENLKVFECGISPDDII
jgi:hypothetical protein